MSDYNYKLFKLHFLLFYAIFKKNKFKKQYTMHKNLQQMYRTTQNRLKIFFSTRGFILISLNIFDLTS